MTDYVIKFSGQDNLSGTINNIKNELKDVGKNTTALDEITKKFQRIQDSSAPLKKKLRDLQTMMAQMNLDGLDKSDVFTQISAQAGAYKDAISDAAQATRLLSSDTATLDAGVQALQGLAGAASIATGVMGLLGSKNEDVQNAILKVQSALGVLNGVQGLSNVLNKNSILMLTIKQAQARAAATAVALESNATKGATVAQAAFNLVAKANPYVLLATAAIAAGAAIYAFTQKTDEATRAQEGISEAAEEANTAFGKGYEAYMKNQLELEQLKTTLDRFNGSKKDEKKLVDELNNKYGTALGKYKDLDSWKKALGNTSYYYCRVLQAEAKLAALNAAAYGAWAKAMSGEDYTENMAKFNKLKEMAADALDDVLFYKKQLQIAQNMNSGLVSSSGSGTKSSSHTKSVNTKTEPVFKDDAKTLKEMQDNVTILRNQLKTLNVNSDKFKEVSKEIERWEILIKNAGKSWRDLINIEGSPLDGLTKELPKIDDIGVNFHLPDHYDLLKKQQEGLVAIADAAKQASEAFGQLGSAIGGTAGEAIGAFGSIAATIAQTVGQVVSLMIANGVSSAMSLPFPANLAAAATVMAGLASIISAIKSAASGSFAEGGIVGGSSMVGDRLLARVNSGEMILNGRQQRNLFNLLDNGGSPSGSGGLVEFKISGSTLKGVLRNYDNKMSKIK